MGTIKVSLPDDEEERFRKAAMEEFGHSRGSLSQAAREAFKQWSEEEESTEFSEEVIDRMSGILSHVDEDKTAIDLEEEANRARAESALD